MYGRVRVGAPDGLLKGGEQVILAVAVPVIACRAALAYGFGVLKGEQQFSFCLPGAVKEQLHAVERLAHVTAAGVGDEFRHAWLGLPGKAVFLAH